MKPLAPYLLIVVLSAALSTVDLPVHGDTLRIMPVGDSITAGYTNNSTGANSWSIDFKFGYRSGLYTRLTNAGVDFKFVGGSQEPFNGAFGDPTRGGTYTPTLDLRDLDQDGHRGYGAQNTTFIRNGMNGDVNNAGWLAVDNPDVVLIHLGTNGRQTAELDGLVGDIVAAKPAVKIIVAQIIPKNNNTLAQKQEWIDYNNYVKNTLIPKYAALGASVSTVDHYTPFLTNPNDPFTYDGALFATGNHPNNEGYDQMAEVWFQGIQAATAVPEATCSLLGWGATIGVIAMRRKQTQCNR